MTQSQQDAYVQSLLAPYLQRTNDTNENTSDQSDSDSNDSDTDDSTSDESSIRDHAVADVDMSLIDLEDNEVRLQLSTNEIDRNIPQIFVPATHQTNNNDNQPKYFADLTTFQEQIINSWRNLTIDEPTICSLKLLKCCPRVTSQIVIIKR